MGVSMRECVCVWVWNEPARGIIGVALELV